MAEDRFHWPPRPSTPREAPWREIEELVEVLKQVSSKLDRLVPAKGAPPVVITEEPFLITGAVHWGQATTAGDATLRDEGKSWETNIWAGYECAIVSGGGAGQVRVIASNTSDTLTLQSAWDLKPDNTSFYVIRSGGSISRQSTGVYLQPEWAAKEGVDKNFEVYGVDKTWGLSAVEYYTVPAGKTLYICGASFAIHSSAAADYDHHLHFHGYLWNTDLAMSVASIGGNGGGQIILAKPIAFAEGNRFGLTIVNYSNVSCKLWATAWGYEI